MTPIYCILGQKLSFKVEQQPLKQSHHTKAHDDRSCDMTKSRCLQAKSAFTTPELINRIYPSIIMS